MLDGYHILTLTHRQVSLETLGQVVVRDGVEPDPADALRSIQVNFGWDELYYLATCNRVMFLFYTQAPVDPNVADGVMDHLRPDLPALQREAMAAEWKLLHGIAAIRHLLDVAASMDSLVVGEREVIRQLRQAYDRCKTWGLTGDHLRLLMRFTIETAKEIYSQTGIGEKALSVVALAFADLLRQGLAKDARILLVGAGQTNSLFGKFLYKYGFRNLTIFNRKFENAQALAHKLEARALPLDALEHYTEGFDALVVCTASTQPIITPALYYSLLAGETSSKVVVDLAVPNNVDKLVPASFPMHFIEIERLREAARTNLAHREQERAKAEALMADRIRAFRQLWHERQVERSLAHIPAEVRAVKDRAVQEVFGKEFALLDPAAQDLMLRMLGYMEKKCIAIPIKAAKAIVLQASAHRSPAPPPTSTLDIGY